MPLDSAQVTSRANSQLLIAAQIVNDVSLSPAVRMELLAAQVDAWHAATLGSVGRIDAARYAQAVVARPGNSHLLPR